MPSSFFSSFSFSEDEAAAADGTAVLLEKN